LLSLSLACPALARSILGKKVRIITMPARECGQ
jgi:hypothetical protein